MTLALATKRQGLAFSVGAWLLVGLSPLFPGGQSSAWLVALLVAVFFLGVPHGALDTLYARYVYRIQSFWAWVAFGLGYSGLAVMVVFLWLATPLVFLGGFLLISAFHFSGDPVEETPAVFRALYGGAIIVLPALLHVQQVTELFSHLSGLEAADRLARILHSVALPWLLAALLAAALHAKKNSIASLEMVSVLALAVVVPPLLAFSMFFCAMHSSRHILRTRRYSEKRSFGHLFQVALPPFFLTLLAAAAGWICLQDESLSARVVQLLFVSLAALTVPHMVLVDGLRFFGRVRGRTVRS